MSIAWIIFLSWILVESWVLLASSLGVSEVIIGLTVLAAGTSVPDLLSSLIVAKQGRGDMAVANALGSNIFDIGICLWIPWIVYLAMSGAPVPVSNGDLSVSIATLFGVLILVVWVFLATNFRINKKVGYIFIAAYICYVVWAIYAATAV
jgi:Ca2+/Na+ antiporter